MLVILHVLLTWLNLFIDQLKPQYPEAIMTYGLPQLTIAQHANQRAHFYPLTQSDNKMMVTPHTIPYPQTQSKVDSAKCNFYEILTKKAGLIINQFLCFYRPEVMYTVNSKSLHLQYISYQLILLEINNC